MDTCFVLKGDICYSKDLHTLHTLPGGYLVCEGGLSAGVHEVLPERYRHYPLTDFGNALLLPGLTDLHAHAPQYSFRALGMDMELLDWLNAHTFPEEAKYQSMDYAKAAYASFVQDLVAGPNTRAVLFATCHVPATLLLMDMLEETGLHTLVGKVNMDRNSHPDLQEADAETSLADTRAWLTQVRAREYRCTKPILTPRFIPSCTDVLLRGITALQREMGLPLQSHLSENLSECAWVKELCPDSDGYGDAYLGFGLFGGSVPTIMAHCVWSDEKEIRSMAKQGVYMAHCPQSNTNLASGIAPVRRFLSQGVPVGLGSDMAGGCHTSIFRAMADAIQMSKLHWRLQNQQDRALTLAEAFYLATKGGGSFFGKVGGFEEGYAFDVLVVDDALLSPLYPLSVEDRLARVTYLSDDRHIMRKYVQGRLIHQSS